jgi:2-desacetyl-2-hydroxyethyl bacteriochlorophyllide A dehydrogenase
MKKLMKALVIHAPYDFRIEEVPIPEITEGEILIKVLGCGICAGDIKAFHGGKRVWGETPDTAYIQVPVVGGHEFFGEVVEIGAGVEGIQLGDHMVSEQIVPCGKCKYCVEGNYWMCKPHHIYGFKYEAQGGYAEYMKFPKGAINHIIPKDMPIEQAALIEPYACAMHAVERGKIKHNDVVVISGLGAIGLGMLTAAKALVPKKLIGLDFKENRLEKAIEFGADYVFNPSKVNIEEEINKLTNGYGCDVYIEASGNEKSVSQGLNLVRNLGRYVQFGVFANTVNADWNIIGDTKEIDIHGAHLSPYCYKPVINGLRSGTLSSNGIISHTYKLEDWKQAYETAEKDPTAIKVVLVP